MDKQKEILQFVYKNGRTTKKEIMDQMPWSYYCNDAFHFGNIISRMVNNKSLKRIKRGVYEYNADQIKTSGPYKEVDPDQTNLF